jgi:DNA-binding NarL/FixJ family response regulator
LRGLLAADDGLDAAFGDALDWHGRCSFPFEEARTRLAYGERLRRARRRADARVHLNAALAIFERLGATQFADRARGELRAAGGREGAPADDDPWKLLTVQESRVAEAILDGATYREAAELLFLSPRTVEHHLRQAYRKLGVRSRSELPLRLRRQ